MKRSRTFISKGLLTGVLIAGMGIVVTQASAQSSAQPTTGAASSSSAMLYASASHNGRPPFKRHAAKEQQLEQVRFARFEEKPGATKDGHKSIYHGVKSKRPPYRRN